MFVRTRRTMPRLAFVAAAAWIVSAPAAAQGDQAAEVARSAVGRVGERQTRADTAPNTVPTARLNGRINNRVQSRIRNRIDRYYDPQANAASPFAVAGEQARTAGRSTGR